jgi:hypothetical protein
MTEAMFMQGVKERVVAENDQHTTEHGMEEHECLTRA